MNELTMSPALNQQAGDWNLFCRMDERRRAPYGQYENRGVDGYFDGSQIDPGAAEYSAF